MLFSIEIYSNAFDHCAYTLSYQQKPAKNGTQDLLVTCNEHCCIAGIPSIIVDMNEVKTGS